jgi:hypothetical protein
MRAATAMVRLPETLLRPPIYRVFIDYLYGSDLGDEMQTDGFATEIVSRANFS